MNQSRKLELSKETLRCLDDEDLTDVAGGWNKREGGGGEQTVVCISNTGNENNSCVCGQSLILCFG